MFFTCTAVWPPVVHVEVFSQVTLTAPATGVGVGVVSGAPVPGTEGAPFSEQGMFAPMTVHEVGKSPAPATFFELSPKFSLSPAARFFCQFGPVTSKVPGAAGVVCVAFHTLVGVLPYWNAIFQPFHAAPDLFATSTDDWKPVCQVSTFFHVTSICAVGVDWAAIAGPATARLPAMSAAAAVAGSRRRSARDRFIANDSPRIEQPLGTPRAETAAPSSISVQPAGMQAKAFL